MGLKKSLYKFFVHHPFRYKKWQRDIPGHFYSPIASRSHFRTIKDEIYKFRSDIPGIDLSHETQNYLYGQVVEFFRNHQLPTGNRFTANNSFFYNGDAMMLYFLHHSLRPKNIVEVGSGYSSALMLDTNDELDEAHKARLTFIEPYPKRLKSLLRGDDHNRAVIIESPVQQVPMDIYNSLGENDILFIDSSHVAKVGSDLNHLLFEVVPKLNKGVWIHFHDIFYNFEYPEQWIMEGRNWNENYLLRAFLQFNDVYKVKFFNSYITEAFPSVKGDIPGFANKFIGSIWLCKSR